MLVAFLAGLLPNYCSGMVGLVTEQYGLVFSKDHVITAIFLLLARTYYFDTTINMDAHGSHLATNRPPHPAAEISILFKECTAGRCQLLWVLLQPIL